MSSVSLHPGYPAAPDADANAIKISDKSKAFFLLKKNVSSKSLEGINSTLSIIGKVIYEKKDRLGELGKYLLSGILVTLFVAAPILMVGACCCPPLSVPFAVVAGLLIGVLCLNSACATLSAQWNWHHSNRDMQGDDFLDIAKETWDQAVMSKKILIVIKEWLSGDFKYYDKAVFIPRRFYFQIPKDKQIAYKERLTELVDGVGSDPYLQHVINGMIMNNENDNCFFQGPKKAVSKAIKLSTQVINELRLSDTQSCWLS